MADDARRITVHGRVQGVGFRAAIRERALELGVHGWVRNEPGGAVTAHVEGDPGAVTELVGFAGTGPPGARVADLEVLEVPVEGTSGFEIR